MPNEDIFRAWGPYLSYGKDPATEMRISWESDLYQTTRRLWYGPDESCDNEVAEEDFAPNRHHCIILSDLTPNTRYYYQINRPAGKLDIVKSPVYSFQTGFTEANDFEFTIVSDVHATKGNNFIQGFEVMERLSPDRTFTIGTGDIVDEGSMEEDWQVFFKQTNSYFHNKPFMNTTGNHDASQRLKFNRFIRTWDHPYVDTKLGGFYSFRFGDAQFIMCDSINGGHGQETFSDEQYEWLDAELEKDYGQKGWIFVFFHHQMYSTGDFSMNPLLHNFIRPLFDEYHVDAVFYGHDHNYQSFWTNRDSDWGGTKYFVCGACGGQDKLEVKIMGSNEGNTIYLWPGRTFIYERDGIPERTPESGSAQEYHRNDEVVRDQLYAIMEPAYVDVKIKGQVLHVRAIGWQEQIFHEVEFKQTKKD